MERTSTGRLGYLTRRLLSSSRPSGPSSEISKTTKSGAASRIACRADVAPSASPQTIRSGSRSMNNASPCRTIGWSSIRKTLHLGTEGFERVLFIGAMSCPPPYRLSRTGAEGKEANYCSPSLGIRTDVERSTYHVGAIAHDIQTHSFVICWNPGNSQSVVLHGKSSLALFSGQSDDHLLRPSVFHRIVHRFSSDMVEVGSYVHVVNQNRLGAFEAARRLEQILHLFSVARESGHQAVRIRDHWKQAARQFSRLVNRLVNEFNNFRRVARLRQRVLSQFALENFTHKGDSRKVLAQSIVQIFANSALFAGTHFQEGLFEAAALCDIDPRHDHV